VSESTKIPKSGFRTGSLKAGSISEDLLNNNYVWTGKVLMDNGKSLLSVLFDMGSDWITLPTKNCTSCSGNRSKNNGSYVP
jgi:hypothetical protein